MQHHITLVFVISFLDPPQDSYLVYILNELAGNSFMIFCSTCNNTQRTALVLRNLGFTAIPLHGQMSQVGITSQTMDIQEEAVCHAMANSFWDHKKCAVLALQGLFTKGDAKFQFNILFGVTHTVYRRMGNYRYVTTAGHCQALSLLFVYSGIGLFALIIIFSAPPE